LDDELIFEDVRLCLRDGDERAVFSGVLNLLKAKSGKPVVDVIDTIDGAGEFRFAQTGSSMVKNG
jgi:hypothetical protein